MTTETWKAVSGFEGLYEVSDLGRVVSLRRMPGKLLRPCKNNGYPRTILTKDGLQHQRLIHRLVLEAFVGPCPDGLQGAHLNGDRADCRLVNLAWVTPKENSSHKVAHGSQLRGETSPKATLTDEQAKEIFRLKGKARGDRLARIFKTNQTTIYEIWSGRRWAQVTGASQ